MRAIAVEGTALNAEVDLGQPGAATLVFINSLGTDFRIWDGVAASLRRRFNIVRHDKRGHGLSPLGAGDVSIATYAADLERLLRTVGADNVVLCGLSVGGLIAQELLLRGKLHIKGAILSNTGLKVGNLDTWNSRIAAIETAGVESIADGVMQRWFSEGFRRTQPELLTLYRTMLARTSAQGYVACCKAIRDAAAFDHSQTKGRAPVLCIGGSVDGSTPPDVVKALAANISGADYFEFEGAGHLPCIERSELYADVVAKFVGGL